MRIIQNRDLVATEEKGRCQQNLCRGIVEIKNLAKEFPQRIRLAFLRSLNVMSFIDNEGQPGLFTTPVKFPNTVGFVAMDAPR